MERVSLILAVTLVAVGVASLLGWWLDVRQILQPFRGHEQLKINSAIAFRILGVLLIAIEFGARRLPWFALVTILIASATLLQNMVGTDFGLEQLLGSDHLQTGTDYPGKMSAIVATCLIFASLVIGWRVTDLASRQRLFAEAAVGLVLALVGFSTLLGYDAGLPAVYTWGQFLRDATRRGRRVYGAGLRAHPARLAPYREIGR